MTQREQFDSPPIKPIYSQTAPNETIEYGTAVKAIYWYIGANNVGFGVNVDSALLFTQAA